MATTTTKQRTEITAETGSLFPDLAECWRYRDLVGMLALRDLRARYKQTALGPLWIVIQPLINMVLFTLLLGVVAKLPSGGKPYALYAYVAMLPWNLFAGIATSSAEALSTNRGIITKIYFPRLALPFAQVISQLTDFAVNVLVLCAMLIAYRQTPTWIVFLLPVYLVTIVMLGLGTGMLFSGVAAKFRDVLQIFALGLRLWMYATPVVYSLQVVPDKWLWVAQMNPLTHVVSGFRAALLAEPLPFALTDMLAVFLVGALILLAGVRVFHVSEYRVVDIA